MIYVFLSPCSENGIHGPGNDKSPPRRPPSSNSSSGRTGVDSHNPKQEKVVRIMVKVCIYWRVYVEIVFILSSLKRGVGEKVLYFFVIFFQIIC